MERIQTKKKTKINHSILILFSLIDLVLLNMHMNFEVSNSYTDWADMMEIYWIERKRFPVNSYSSQFVLRCSMLIF